MSTPLSVSHTNLDRISPARSSPPSSTTSSVHLSTHAASEHSNGAPSSSSPYINNQQRSPQAFPTQASGSSIRPPYSPQTVAGPSRPSQPQPSQSQSSIPSSPQLDIPNGSLQQSTLYNAADPQALQALLSPAHQAMQANMQRPHEDASLYAGGGKQIQPERGERRLSGPTPEWAAAATAMRGDGTMSNMQGASKEAILKQLQALQSSHAQRARLASAAQPSTPQSGANGISAPSPASFSAPSPASASSAAASLPPQSGTFPSGNAVAGPSAPSQHTAQISQNSQSSDPVHPASTVAPTPGRPPVGLNGVQVANGPGTGPAAAGLQMTQQQKDFLLAQQDRIRACAAQQQQPQQPLPPRLPPSVQNAAATTSHLPSSPKAPSPGRPQAGARPPQTLAEQRRQFLSSLASFHKQYNLSLPREIFNREKDGAVKVGDSRVEMLDLFMLVMKNQGIANVVKQSPDSHLWQSFLRANQVPSPLAEAIPLPRPPNAPPDAPVNTTTNPVQYLLAAYLTWLQPFEQHMTRHRQANQQRQAAAAGADGRPPSSANGTSQPGQAPSPAQTTVSSPAPNGISTSSGLTTSSSAPATESFTTSNSNHIPQAKDARPAPLPKSKSKELPNKPVPTPIKTDVGMQPTFEAVADTPAANLAKKRKRDKRGLESGDGESGPSIPAGSSTALTSAPAALPPERPATPKRARYRVEYRPLHPLLPTLGGWDERSVVSTLPKNNLGHSSRSIHELGIVDMEAVLMGLRSRLPRELGYALTVLSMLSMPHPEENIGGLPLTHLPEIYLELLDLVGEATFGEDGFEVWDRKEALRKRDGVCATADLNQLSFVDLEQLGQDMDISLEEDEGLRSQRARDQTGGQTDIILASLNILRNFSMLQENQRTMASRPELIQLLAAVSDARLCRFPGDLSSGKPYSMLELARIRRDVVCILTNVGTYTNLRGIPFMYILAIFHLLTTYLTTGWEAILAEDSPYGPSPSVLDGLPPIILSINRAIEAFSKLATSDANREVLSHVPSEGLVSLFAGLIRLLPSTPRSFEAMHTMEDYLAHTESLTHCLYSLVFLAPSSARAGMRSTPGAVGILTRLIFDTVGRGYDFKSNPFGILCRRLCETLGVLNGTVSASGDVERMGFSAGSGGGKGWKFASKVVEKGLLASEQERLMDCLGVRGLDLPAFGDLDGMWWVGAE